MPKAARGRQRAARRALDGVVGVVVGVVVATAGALWHNAWYPVAGHRWPVGLLAVVIIATAVVAALSDPALSRAALVGFVLAWSVVTMGSTFPGPGDDILLANTTLGQIYPVLAAVSMVTGVTLSRRASRRTPAVSWETRG